MAKKQLQKGGQVQDDSITIRLRLTGLRVLAVKEAGKWIEVVAQYRDNEAVCPRCERSTWQVHQWHLQRKRDARLGGKEVWVALLTRRFRCRHCRKVFTEPDPACGPRRRTTGRLRQTVATRAREATVRTVAREGGAGEGLGEGGRWRWCGGGGGGTCGGCWSAMRRGRACGLWPSTCPRPTGRRWSWCCLMRRLWPTSSTCWPWPAARCKRYMGRPDAGGS